MSSDDTYCPVCDRCFKWYETVCPSCGGDLSDAGTEAAATIDVEGPPAVAVFESNDAGEADVVRAALAQEGIACVVSGPSPFVASDTGERSIVTVLREDAERARAVVDDLDAEDDGDATDAAPASALPAPGPGPEPAEAAEPGLATIYLHDAESGLFVGRINEAQLEFLAAHLEEDTASGTYYVDAATIDMLADRGAGGDADRPAARRPPGEGRRRDSLVGRAVAPVSSRGSVTSAASRSSCQS